LSLLLYYITDRKQFPGDAAEQRRQLLRQITAAAHAGVDFIQLREKDLTTRELERLAAEAVGAVRPFPATKLLINSRADVAIAAGAHGVHLRSDDISAADARGIWLKAGAREGFFAVSCHSAKAVALAEAHGADLVVLGPIFEKSGEERAPIGLRELEAAMRRPAVSQSMPVLALGGVTLENAEQCIRAGASGIAAIRLFQREDVAEVVRKLRAMKPSAKPGKAKHPYWPR
jgi:thiamine-phosphate pyrophosphorylase